MLPDEFIQQTRLFMGDELWRTLMQGLQQAPTTSIRLHPVSLGLPPSCFNHPPSTNIPWCAAGRLLSSRPNFTFDPLLHAGLYYVQEPSSMFLDRVLKQHLCADPATSGPIAFLDLCAAPGGKSTVILSALPKGSTLVSNEPNRQRAQVLSENIQKWTLPYLPEVPYTSLVTNNLPADFHRARATFDAILCDVPCSGEGMFRKDPATIDQWSPQAVEKCARLQREIVAEAWHCLVPGGLFIYSTCTFNTKENEENVQWMVDELGAMPLSVDTDPEWNITGSLLSGFDVPVYRFIPGLTQGEGLFMAVMRKPTSTDAPRPSLNTQRLTVLPPLFINELQDALRQQAPIIDIPYQQAIQYLRREAIVLPPETPKGIVVIAYQGHPLGLAKNIGNRANNLYPKPWRIKTTHFPT